MKPKSNYMPPEQFQLLLDNVKLLQLKKISPMKIEDIQMLFKIARYCALRITEAIKLNAEDIDAELLEVTIRESKTSWEYCSCCKFETIQTWRGPRKKLTGFDIDCKKCKGKGKIFIPVQVTIPKAFGKELGKFIENKKNRLFQTNRHTVHYWLKTLGEKLDITSLTVPQQETHEKTKCHIFRKSFGKDMHYQGLSLNAIQSKFRHKDLATTTQYLKLNLEDVKKAEEDLKI